MLTRHVLAFLCLFACANVQAQNKIAVPGSFAKIQDAIAAAVDGDTVLVGPGTYRENIDFLGKAITVQGSGASGANASIIDGGANGHVVTFTHSEGPNSVLTGFVVTNGLPTTCDGGGGIFISYASPQVVGNTISGNTAPFGGGIFVQFGSPVITGNRITANQYGGACLGGLGGGGIIVLGAASPEITDNEIDHNTAVSSGGAIHVFGGTMARIANNRIHDNVAGSDGGAVSVANNDMLDIVQNVFYGNTTAGNGGAINWLVPSGGRGPFVINNTFFNNDAASGSAIFADGYDKDSRIQNNIVVAKAGQVAIACGDFNDLNLPIIANNLTFTSGAASYGGPLTACNDALLGTSGNVAGDPKFVDLATFDFHLQSSSPAIDKGDNLAPQLPATDFDLHRRVLSASADCTATVDMGVFEFVPNSSASVIITPSPIAFGNQALGTNTTQSVTISNTDTICRGIRVIGIHNTLLVDGIDSASGLQASSDCPSDLAAGATCHAFVAFAPAVRMTYAGQLGVEVLTNPPSNDFRDIPVSGRGVALLVSFSRAAADFGPQLVGTVSAPVSVALSNTGDAPVTVTQISVVGDFTYSANCGALAPGASCTLSLTFKPLAYGSHTGAITIVSNAQGSPHTISLSGTATDFALAIASGGTTSKTIVAGQSATFDLSLLPASGFTGITNLACAGAPALSTCTVSPVTLNVSGSAPANFTVTFSTTPRVGGTVANLPAFVEPHFGMAAAITAVLAGFIVWVPRRRARWAWGFATMLVVVALTLAGCGGGGSAPRQPGPTQPGTAVGTYNLTISATATGVVRSMPLTVTVN